MTDTPLEDIFLTGDNQYQAALVDAWHTAIAPTMKGLFNPDTLRQHLVTLTEQMITLLTHSSFSPEQAHAIGAALCSKCDATPETLEATLLVCDQYWRTSLPVGAYQKAAPRLGRLAAGIAAGFAAQLTASALAIQPTHPSTALTALADALQPVPDQLPLFLMTIDHTGIITAVLGSCPAESESTAAQKLGLAVHQWFASHGIAMKAYHQALNGEFTTCTTAIGERYYQICWIPSMPPMADSAVLVCAFDITTWQQAHSDLETDHTQLKQHIAQRTAELSEVNARLLQASQLRDSFLMSISHELRTPLNIILGFTDTLREEIHGPLNHRQTELVYQIDASGQRLLQLINNILDLARLTSGKVALDRYPVSITSICQTCLNHITPQVQAKSLHVTTSIDPEITTVLADGQRLAQLLSHLLDNAVKFTPEHGKIGLSVTGDPERHTVSFSIWDTGIGIRVDDFARLFQPFSQIDGSLSRPHGGTGLGLAFVYYLTELHGGSVSLTSTPSQGSQFTVSLPWNKEKIEGTVGDPAIEVVAGQPQILLAEDDLDLSNLMSRYLRKKGYNVVVAYNGNEAIARAEESHPDLILMDIQMPVLNGIDAIKRIRAHRDIGHTPIIAVTALAIPGHQERCLAAGADVYLNKPISMHVLSQAIEDLRQHLSFPPPE